MSNLCLYISDPNHIISYEPLQLKENLTYIEEPVKILERMDQMLRNKTIPFVKVLWKHHQLADAPWEPEHVMREKYSELFSSGM